MTRIMTTSVSFAVLLFTEAWISKYINTRTAPDLAQSVSHRRIPKNELILRRVYFGNDKLSNANYSLIEAWV